MKKTLSIIMILAMILSMVPVAFATDPASDGTTVTVQLQVRFGQSEARTMLDMINKFRTGSDAWYWNENNTAIVDVTGRLSELVYDYTLEKAAMQRAAEIALSYSHTRPNETSCFTALDEAGYQYYAVGENIAAGYSTAESVFVGWQETDKLYDGQVHRRNMLNSNFAAVGIGHVYYNGCHYWVQEFGTPSSGVSDTDATTANDALTPVDVSVLLSNITVNSLTAGQEALTVSCGGSAALPALTAQIQTVGTWPENSCAVTVSGTWSVVDTRLAQVSGSNVTGLQAGETELTAAALGTTVSVLLTVEHSFGGDPVFTWAEDHASATATFTCVNGDDEQNLDCVVTYETASEATCTETGSVNYTATVTFGGKTYTNTQTKSIPALGHDYEATVTKEPTATEEGVRTYTCTRCNDSYTESIPALGHNGDDGTATPSPTPSATPSPTPSATPSPTPSATPSPTPSATPSPTPSATPSPTPSATPSPTPSATPSPTPSATPSPTPSATPTPTPSATPSPTPSATPSPTPSATPSPTPSATPSPTPSATPTPTPSATPTPTPTATPSPSPSTSPSPSPDAHSHYWSPAWSSDSAHHWKECLNTGCTVTNAADKEGYGDHEFGAWRTVTAATATTSGTMERSCYCGYKETKQIPPSGNTGDHTHDWGHWTLVSSPNYYERVCKTCGAKDIRITSVAAPSITSGDGAVWKQGSDTSLSFSSSAPVSEFLTLTIDNYVVDASYYTLSQSSTGGTTVVLKAELLRQLASGSHTLGIVSSGGTATASFTIQRTWGYNQYNPSNTNPWGSPQTGDTANMGLWIALICVSLVGVAVVAVVVVKKAKNKQDPPSEE